MNPCHQESLPRVELSVESLRTVGRRLRVILVCTGKPLLCSSERLLAVPGIRYRSLASCGVSPLPLLDVCRLSDPQPSDGTKWSPNTIMSRHCSAGREAAMAATSSQDYSNDSGLVLASGEGDQRRTRLVLACALPLSAMLKLAWRAPLIPPGQDHRSREGNLVGVYFAQLRATRFKAGPRVMHRL